MAMKKSHIILIILLLVAAVFAIVIQLGDRVGSKTVLVLMLDKPVAEEDWPDFSARFWEGEVVVFRNLIEALERARRDEHIAGVSLEIHHVGMGVSQIQELRAKLQELAGSGKFCVAYLEEASNMNYYLASACPEVYLTPTSGVYLTGLMGHSTFLRGTLDKLHIYPDLYSIADYKTAKNHYTEKKFTPQHREMVTQLVTSWQRQLVEGIAIGRKLEPAAVEELIRGGPYLATEAVEKKLIDKLLYYDEYRDLLKKKAGADELRTVSAEDYLRRSRGRRGPTIAIVHATGEIVPGHSGYDPNDGRYMGSTTVAEALKEARENSSVKAIVLRIDSPGGSAIASEIIRREVVKTKEAKKPIVVSMSDVAASGGYWISMSADRIVAEPGTITGSIGVVTGKFNVKGLYELLGMTNDYVALAPNSTMFYPFENFTPEQRENLMKFMNDIYQNFIARVAEGRKLEKKRVDEIGRGRVWLGQDAKQLGLVDELGGLEKAVAVAKQLAGIAPDQDVAYAIYPREKTFFEQFGDWLQTRGQTGLRPRAWLDPAQSRLWREPVLVLMPLEVEPR